MAERRDGPYIWVTWLTRLLAGEANCEWALWFRAHHRYEKREPEGKEAFDLAKWTAQHGAMVREKGDELRSDGYAVFLEDQNKFNLPGKAATVGGKPDIVAAKGNEVLVVECKTGKRRKADYFQAMVYMMLLPYTHRACKGKTVAGLLRYSDGEEPIPADGLTGEMRQMIRRTIENAAATTPARRVPSAAECGMCDISAADCPERVDGGELNEPAADHNLF